MASRRPRFPGVHLLRVGLFAAAVALIHFQHEKLTARRATNALAGIPIGRLQAFFPEAQRIGDATPENGRQVLAADGRILGQIVQSAPESDRFVGFSGPTNVLIALSPGEVILGAEILRSGDTRDHVEAVVRSAPFWDRLTGKTPADLVAQRRVDGVSGATLTSIAIQQGLAARFGGKAPATKFPDPPALETVRQLFAEATEIRTGTDTPLIEVLRGDRILGQILRTSPVADNIVGYQGPTDALIGLAPDGRIVGVALGKTFDNEEYVAYVRGDTYFRELWNGLTLPDLAGKDFASSGVEGVSGATMTSVAVTKGLFAAAREASKPPPAEPGSSPSPFPWRLAGTAAVVLAGVTIGLTKLRGARWLRRGLQAVLVLYLGFLNGELLSQAMLVGWAQSGIPLQGAAGLVLLAVAAFLVPIVTRRNVYCSHLCPHGAVQEWLRPSPSRQWHVPPRWAAGLRAIRPLLLVWIMAVALWQWPFSLVDIEPFDAYLWRTAGWATISLAVAGLVASAFVPMAYCRFGCPTGAVLDYVRLHGQGSHLTGRDWFALALVGLGGLVAVLS